MQSFCRSPEAILNGRSKGVAGGPDGDRKRIEESQHFAEVDGFPIGPIVCRDRWALKTIVTEKAQNVKIGGGGWGVNMADYDELHRTKEQ